MTVIDGVSRVAQTAETLTVHQTNYSTCFLAIVKVLNTHSAIRLPQFFGKHVMYFGVRKIASRRAVRQLSNV